MINIIIFRIMMIGIFTCWMVSLLVATVSDSHNSFPNLLPHMFTLQHLSEWKDEDEDGNELWISQTCFWFHMFTQEHISKFRTLIRMRMNSNPIYPTSRGDDDDDEWVNRKLIPKLPTHIFTGMSPSVICIVIQMRRRRKIFRENATQPNHNQHNVGAKGFSCQERAAL